ncbi:MAG: hypothetical protein OEW85_05140, partial [Acidimicrobiia bacterium]|nr:hypothetical protein [Acidimicrobiia bacterium]
MPIDLGGMADELLFHVMTDPARRELAFGAEHLQPGEVEDGLVRTSDPRQTAPATRADRSGGPVTPPPLSPRLAERLGTGPLPGPGGPGDGGDDEAGRDRHGPEQILDIADDEFVVVGADWEVGWALDQLDRTGTLVAVIQRPDGPDTDYYLRHRGQLESIDRNLTIFEGLGLRESGVAPTIESIAPLERARRIDEPTVVIDNGLVAGFLLPVREAAAAPPPRTRRRTTRGGGPGTAVRGLDGVVDVPDETVTRRLEAELPSKPSVGEEVSIVVSLSAEGVLGDLTVGADVVGNVGDGVDLILSTRSGVELAGPHQHQIAITADGSPQYRQFKVKAIAVGQASMQLLAFIDGQNVAVLPLGLQVVEAPSGGPEPLRAVAALERPPYDDPDLTLLIYEQLVPGQGPTLQFTLTGRDPDLELNLEPFGHVAFRADPDTFFAEYFGDIEELLPPTHFPADVVDRKVKAMGAKLYDDVVPADLRDQLWAIRDRVESILIQSTDPWVPWEMCFLTGPDETGAVVEHGFVCERYDVSRWIQGVPFRVDLTLDRVALVVTGDSGLPSAQAEAATVRRLQDAGVQVDDVAATYDGVYQALAGGSYTGFHFTGHGL